MGGAIVEDPEDSARRPIRLLSHHLIDEPAERFDTRRGFASAEESGAMHVESGEIGPRATALVLVLDARS
jgi:hypothetical protein